MEWLADTQAWILQLTAPILTVLTEEISGRDLILIAGGLFLIGKSTHEIHNKLEGEEVHAETKAAVSFCSIIVQILLLDLVFSLDSVITAIGMAEDVVVMITAVVMAVGVMMVSAGAISAFINEHPTIRMLALSFLLLIGVTLVAESLDRHIPKGYIYSAMAFSLFVEMLNPGARRRKEKPVHLRELRLEHSIERAEAARRVQQPQLPL